MANMEGEPKSISEQQNIRYKTIRCRVLTGILHQQNKGAIDWGWQSLVAYGCQTTVVVVDSKSIQVLQTLSKHRMPVVKVKWAKENYYHDLSNPYYPKLASADTSGVIIVWDVIYSKSISSFSEGNRPILDMEWLSFWSGCNDFLAVLHPPYSFVIWNATNGNKLWKKSYTETLLSFSFDPFDPSNVAFLAQDSILFIDDFTLNRVPSSNGRKFYISNPSSVSTSTSNLMTVGANPAASDEKLWTAEKLRRRVRHLVTAELRSSSKQEESSSSNECLGLTYHKACRHHLLLLYSKEMLIIDLEINQTVGIIAMERNGSPFNHVVPCQQRDALFCLHDNGSISLRVRKRNATAPVHPPEVHDSFFGTQGDSISEGFIEVSYESRCQSDSLRLTKHARLMGMACCPVSEKKTALLMSDGRLLFLELLVVDKNLKYQSTGINIVSDHFNGASKSTAFCLEPNPPKISLSDILNPLSCSKPSVKGTKESEGTSVSYKLLLTGLLAGLAAPPLVIRMCPPLTTKNWSNYNPWLAVGTTQGTIQILCMASGMLQKELSFHTCPVRGIEWVSLHGILTFAYPNLVNPSGLVRNELILANVATGKMKMLRLDKGDESPIEMIRISYHKQYFIVAFKDEPFELWDLQRLILLRTMPKKFPVVTALEWSPVCGIKKKAGSSDKASLCEITPTTELPPLFAENSFDPKLNVASQEKILTKEHFVFTDTDGQLYNFSVEGNVIKDGFKIPADGNVGSITCIAWRSDQIVMGDVDGNLTQWELKAKTSTIIPTHRGWIKKIRFAPGRGNMKILILYNNGVDIWDLREMERVSSLKCPADIPKIQDIDWAASDTAVLATIDGCLYLMDLKLKHSTSATYRYHLHEPVFIPYLSTSEAALNLRTFLQHQGWRSKYSLEFSETDGIRGDDLTALQNYIANIDSDISDYLPLCTFGTAQRCLLTAKLFGDESEYHFWTVALYCLRAQKEQIKTTNELEDSSSSTVSSETGDGKQTNVSRLEPLDTCYDIFCDSMTFKRRQLDRVALHDNKRTTYEQTKKCAETLIMLGQTDRAVQLLLETESDNDNYYTDNLRACLVASVRSSGAAQSTIKLVATNLIANGRISEGVQLLCLIDKAVDACRYLQSYGYWNRAAWLAKATLNTTDCLDVMKRWIDHLCSTQNQKQKAVLMLLSMGQFQKVVELLVSMKCIERAAMFIHSCQEFFTTGIIINNSLVEAVFLEYARYLFSLGNTTAAYHYCNIVGKHGEQLRKEMEILSEDSNP